MKASELRVGNFVSDIHASDFFYAAVKELKKDRCYYGTFHSAYQDLRPIPLTEEWLLRFGFKKADEGHFWLDLKTHYFELIYSNLSWYPLIAHLPEMSSEEEQRVGLSSIYYVHQLQNLFFALFGQELTIKEAAR